MGIKQAVGTKCLISALKLGFAFSFSVSPSIKCYQELVLIA